MTLISTAGPSALHFSCRRKRKTTDSPLTERFYDPVAGEVIDLVGGQPTSPQNSCGQWRSTKRFAEDRLSQLRAVRFAAVLDYRSDMEPGTRLWPTTPSINQISAERIREELVRIFLSPNRVRGGTCSMPAASMRAILPELEAMKGVLQPEQFHPEGDVSCTPADVSMLPGKFPFRWFSRLLFNDVAKPVTATGG